MAKYTKGNWRPYEIAGSWNIIGKKKVDIALHLTNKYDASLICSAVNMCISINPENPLAVAEWMGSLLKAGREALFQLEWEYNASLKEDPDCGPPGGLEELKQALASIERGK